MATVRKCRTVAKTETVGVRRYYREGCQPFRAPTERPLFVVGVPRIESTGAAHTMVSCAWKSPSPKISPEISPVRTFKKPCIFKGLREISPISPKSPRLLGCRGCVVSCARNPGFRRESHSTQEHEPRIILSWAQRRLFPRFGPSSLHNNFYGT